MTQLKKRLARNAKEVKNIAQHGKWHLGVINS